MARLFPDRPVLCGHRGMGAGTVGGYEENTLDSFRAAVAAGLRWVEVDARATVDGVLVARHDPAVADGRAVATLTAKETDALGLARIAGLLDALPAGVGIDIEVKTALEDAGRPRGATTAALVAGLLGAPGSRPVLVTSFDPAALLIVRERADVPVGLLTWVGFPLRKAVPAAVHLGVDVLLAHTSSFGPGRAAAALQRPVAESVGAAHAAGLEVAVWCPTPAQAAPLVAAGVDCLIVDHVDARTWAEPGPSPHP